MVATGQRERRDFRYEQLHAGHHSYQQRRFSLCSSLRLSSYRSRSQTTSTVICNWRCEFSIVHHFLVSCSNVRPFAALDPLDVPFYIHLKLDLDPLDEVFFSRLVADITYSFSDGSTSHAYASSMRHDCQVRSCITLAIPLGPVIAVFSAVSSDCENLQM